MGGGRWSNDVFTSSKRGLAAFDYDRDTRSRPREQWKIYKMLDPKGLKIRESRDSEEHPDSNAIAVGLDVTGSMRDVVVAIQQSLGKLMAMLLTGNFVNDPQLLFYAVGDATCDTIPFQVSQFESDNRINEQITKIILEGGGGGQMTESYELGFYFAARHTSIDCWEKRQRKGYLFSIGDEMPYPNVNAREVKEVFGADLAENIPTSRVVKEVQERYHMFHIIPAGSANFNVSGVYNAWVKYLGDARRVFRLADPEAACDLIAVIIGLTEGKLTLEQAVGMINEKNGIRASFSLKGALEEYAKLLKAEPKPAPSKTKSKDAPTSPKKDGAPDEPWRL